MLSGFQLVFFGIFAKILLGEEVCRGLTLERAAAAGIVVFTAGFLWALGIGWYYVQSGFRNLPPLVYSVLCLTLMAIGLRTFFASFMLSLIAEQKRTRGYV